MPAIDEERLKQETANIKVESYQRTASLGGWAGGGRTLWAIGIVGAVTGAAIGAVAPFVPVIVGASTIAQALGAVGTSVAAFAATGISMGFSGGLILGRISGSAAAVAEENERRMKEWTARQLLQNNPEAHIIPDAPKTPEPKKPFFQRLKDNYRTYVNPRVGLTFAAVGVVAGLIMAAAFISTGGAAGAIMPALGALTGIADIASNTTAIAAYTAGVAGAFGSIFAFNYSKITSATTHYIGEVMSGRALGGREWKPKESPKPAIAQEQPTTNEIPTPAEITKSALDTVRKHTSYADMVTQQAAQSTNTQIQI